jgi:uncharacterized membrane protein YeaQ/YmgE (transglycosylase-associated protein family)
MANGSTPRLLPYGLGLALLATAAHLGWESTHGGVQSHHLLNRADLPAISNWWGLLFLPVLGWLASRVVDHRVASRGGTVARALAAFAGALLLGAALSVAFATRSQAAASGIFFSILAAGLVVRTYRAEYVFGFVLGMTFVFGSVLPTLVASVAATISAVSHLVARPACAWALRRARA